MSSAVRLLVVWRAIGVLAFTVCAACGSGGSDGSGSGLPAVGGPVAPKLEVTATEMRFSPASIAVAGGDVPVALHNGGTVIHDLRVDGKPSLLLEAPPGQAATATWALGKGRYRIYCSVDGHRAAGMEGVLEVR